MSKTRARDYGPTEIHLKISDGVDGQAFLYFDSGTGDELAHKDFDMPPHPPSGAFDARFATNKMLEMVSN